MNLLPWRAMRRSRQKHNVYIHILFTVCIAFMMIYMADQIVQRLYQTYEKRYQHDVSVLDHIKTQYRHFLQEENIYNQKIFILREVGLSKKNILQTICFFEYVKSMLPTGVLFERISYDRGQVSLTGRSDSQSSLSKLLHDLPHDLKIEHLQLPEVNMNQDAQEFKFDFILKNCVDHDPFVSI